MTEKKSVTIGGAAGMWGDSILATPQLLADARCDYVIYEGLAEITMAILTKARAKDPEQGYARDLIEIIAENLRAFAERGVKVVTNAGGVNPHAAAAVLRAAAEAAGVQRSIAVVTGDDVLHTDLGDDTRLDAGAISANAYLGARPIAAALGAGADVVLTGRVVDSALTLGPLIHEFGWSADDLDLLSAGSLAGHLLECGPQSTGGLLTDWTDTTSWANPGYPIAIVGTDGGFEMTCADGTDGLVDPRSVGEQVLYEIGDPTAYLLPDVTCDWSGVELTQTGPNRVRVTGARGRRPVPTLKACAQIPDGFRVAVQYFVGGRDAVGKARRTGDDIVARWRRVLADRGHTDFRAVNVYAVGDESSYGAHARTSDARESLVWVSAHHDDPRALRIAVREFPSIGLGGAPGTGGAAGAGLPKPSPVLRVQEVPVPRGCVSPIVEVDGAPVPYTDVDPAACAPVPDRGPDLLGAGAAAIGGRTVPLIDIAYGRSGDKGDSSNIGIIARDPKWLPYIAEQLTAPAVATWLEHLGAREVLRFALPGMHAVNFLLVGGLGTSGAASTRIDPQGKALAQQLLDFPIILPND